jgi:hypothetical protein
MLIFLKHRLYINIHLNLFYDVTNIFNTCMVLFGLDIFNTCMVLFGLGYLKGSSQTFIYLVSLINMYVVS